MPGMHDRNTAVIDVLPATADRPRVMYRYAGDRFLLVEYGEMVLDLTMNFRIFGLNDTAKKPELAGLRSVQAVIDYICATEWWNACIGFWPGLPFMFPLDPRYAIVTPKYNPTRPWTPEGAVGIGGPCVAIYPVQSPGGYQLFGRTIPIFDLKQRNPAFKMNPILLKPADRIQWVPVSDAELESIREKVYDGTYRYKIVAYEALNVKSYLGFLDSIKSEIAAFQQRQAEAVKHVAIP